jgi:Fic family protein
MTAMKLQIFPTGLLEQYLQLVPEGLQEAFDKLTEAELSTDTFSFYTSVASVFSSKIEGEPVDLDSYIKHRKFHAEFQPDYTKKTDDLYNAYIFAQHNPLNSDSVSEAHKLLSKHLVTESQQGEYRSQNMYVTTDDGRIEYVAASPFEVKEEMKKFYADLKQLIQQRMNIEEAFFFASLSHLIFAKIHPWMDGNGRTARLIEKWFLAEKLGKKTWYLQSEKNYYGHHQIYYKKLRSLGLEYDQLDYSKALPFLLMLPESLFKV